MFLLAGMAGRARAARAGRGSALPCATALVLAALVTACSPSRTVEAVGLLRDIAGNEHPSGISRREISYGPAGRRAHLYEAAAPQAALVLVPGAAAEALEDPRLVGLAEALGRRGFVVMVPELAGEDPLQVRAADADAVEQAIRHLRATEGVPALGLAAPSYAAGPTILAALRPGTRDGVAFIIAIGGYYDIIESIAFITTGAFRESPGGPWRRGPVDERAKWVFLRANTGWLTSRTDARLLEAIAGRRLAGAGSRGREARLGPEGRRVLALFTNRSPERVPDLIAALPERMRAEIEALDLARRDLGALEAELILVHGRNDPLVPYTQSIRLAEAVGPEHSTLHLLRDLSHVDLGAPGLADGVALVRIAYQILARRDAAPAPRRPAPEDVARLGEP